MHPNEIRLVKLDWDGVTPQPTDEFLPILGNYRDGDPQFEVICQQVDRQVKELRSAY